VCISYDIPEIEIQGKKKLSGKGKLGGGGTVLHPHQSINQGKFYSD
jgi:hypothetical protein